MVEARLKAVEKQLYMIAGQKKQTQHAIAPTLVRAEREGFSFCHLVPA